MNVQKALLCIGIGVRISKMLVFTLKFLCDGHDGIVRQAILYWVRSCYLNPTAKSNIFWKSWSRGYKTFFMLNSAEHEIFPAHKC